MPDIKEGQYVINSVKYKNPDPFKCQVISYYPDGRVLGSRYVQGADQIWTVTGNNETGYTIEIAPDKQFLTAVDNIVKSSDESTLWNIVDEGEERYKIAYKGYGKVAKLTGGQDFDPIVLVNYTDEDDQLWNFVPYTPI